jgi:hypothetical protein
MSLLPGPVLDGGPGEALPPWERRSGSWDACKRRRGLSKRERMREEALGMLSTFIEQLE